MSPPIEGFDDEYAFFGAATIDLAAREAFRTWIEWVAEEEVKKLVAAGASLNRHVLFAAAMEPFDRAFRHYAKHEASSPRDYPFSAYYRWWARQFATARLHKN
jgi:hypothetical protein